MTASALRRHDDGTVCREGTKRVPPRFRACCEVFRGHTTTCELDLRYEWWPKARRWFIAISDAAGGGGIVGLLDAGAWATFGGVEPQPIDPSTSIAAKVGTMVFVTVLGAVCGLIGGGLGRRRPAGSGDVAA